MKKIAVFLALILTLTLALSAACAENAPLLTFYDSEVSGSGMQAINPYADIAHSPTYYAPEESDSGMDVSLACEAEPAMGVAGEWSVTVTGGEAPYTYQYYVLSQSWSTNTYKHWSENSVFTHEFMQPGSYILLANVQDSAGSIVSARAEITVQQPALAVHATATTVAEKVAQVVSECQASVNTSDEYAVALWLHDWLTHNAYYDQTFTYYDADGVLLRGTGVCDSYAKAYVQLLQTAGLEAKRVTGYGNGDSHAWAVVKIDGEWYHIDPTWDDPLTGNPTQDKRPVSGVEGHTYFGLPDIIMKMDHSWSAKTDCTAYAANYEIHSGSTMRMLNANVEAAERAKLFEVNYFPTFADIQEKLSKAKTFPVRVSTSGYLVEKSGSGLIGYRITPRTAYLIAYLLGQQSWEYYGYPAVFTVSYDASAAEILFSLDLSQNLIPKSLTTPSSRVPVGSPVTYTLHLIGEDDIESLEYQVYNEMAELVASWEGFSDTFTFIPDAPGEYVVRALFKPTSGDWTLIDSESLTVFSISASVKSASGKGSYTVGDSIVASLDAEGYFAYNYWLFNDQGVIVQEHTNTTDASWTFTVTTPGLYLVRIYGTDFVTEGYDDTSWFIVQAAPPVKVKNVTLSSSSIVEGDKVTLSATVSGGAISCAYNYWIFDSYGTIVMEKTNTFDTSATFTFSKPGLYLARVYATDFVTDAYADSEWFVVAPKDPVVVSSVNVASSSIVKGDKVKVTANVSGGTGTYAYNYWVFDGTGTIVMEKTNTFDTSAEFTFDQIGIYLVRVYATDFISESYTDSSWFGVSELPTIVAGPLPPAEEPVEEPVPEPGSSFETAIRQGSGFTATVDGTVYYVMEHVAAGTYSLRLRTPALAKGAVTVSLYNAAQSPVWTGRTDNGELDGTLQLAEGLYYVVLTSDEPARVDLALTEYVEPSEEPAQEPTEEPTEEPAEEPTEESVPDLAEASEAEPEADLPEEPVEAHAEAEAEAPAAPDEP